MGIIRAHGRSRKKPQCENLEPESAEHNENDTILSGFRTVRALGRELLDEVLRLQNCRRSISGTVERLEKMDDRDLDHEVTQRCVSDLEIEASMLAIALSKPRVRDDVPAQINELIGKLLLASIKLNRSFASRARTGVNLGRVIGA